MEASSGEPAGRVLELDSVKANWPAPGYRQYQEQTLNAIVNVLNERRVCVLDAPVGSGKSYVLMAIAAAYDGSVFYTTPQNMLIEQMNRDRYLGGRFEFITGRRNYVCPIDFKTCDVAICKTKKSYECELKYDDCPYWGQKVKAVNHKVCLTNFSYFISEGFIPEEAQCPKLGSRELLVVDEGHSIEDVANDFVSLTVSRRTVPKIMYNDIPSMLVRADGAVKTFEDVKQLLAELSGKCAIVLNTYEDRDLDEDEVKDRERVVELSHKIGHVLDDEGEWVWWFENDDSSKMSEGKRVKLILKPIKVDRFMHNLMWRRVDRVIIASGTPPTYPGAMADIGLATRSRLVNDNGHIHRVNGETIHKTIHVPSTFPVENRPIIDRSVGYMTKKCEGDTLPKAISMVDEILHNEKDFRGIIHANSYRHAELLRDRLSESNRSRLVFHTSEDRSDVLKDWLSVGVSGKLIDNRVLVSVRMEEGLDLKDDLARFQVLFKVMYPNLTDRRVARRLELGERDWYNNITIMKIIQSYGRAVRSPEDWARYYVVDKSFYKLVGQCRKFCPPWFLEAIIDE